MPKAEEDDEFDAEDLHERLVLCKIILELNIELDEAVHGYCHGCGFEYHDPDMAESRTERGLAVAVEELCDHGHESEDHANDAVLVDAHVNDLHPSLISSTSD